MSAWRWYDGTAGEGGGVGFRAELHVVEEGGYETVFRNVGPVGLGTVATLVPASGRRRPGPSGAGAPRSTRPVAGTEPP